MSERAVRASAGGWRWWTDSTCLWRQLSGQRHLYELIDAVFRTDSDAFPDLVERKAHQAGGQANSGCACLRFERPPTAAVAHDQFAHVRAHAEDHAVDHVVTGPVRNEQVDPGIQPRAFSGAKSKCSPSSADPETNAEERPAI